MIQGKFQASLAYTMSSYGEKKKKEKKRKEKETVNKKMLILSWLEDYQQSELHIHLTINSE